VRCFGTLTPKEAKQGSLLKDPCSDAAFSAVGTRRSAQTTGVVFRFGGN
jgi:hypothetical protein